MAPDKGPCAGSELSLFKTEILHSFTSSKIHLRLACKLFFGNLDSGSVVKLVYFSVKEI